MFEILFGSWTGILSLIVLGASTAIIVFFLYKFLINPPQE